MSGRRKVVTHIDHEVEVIPKRIDMLAQATPPSNILMGAGSVAVRNTLVAIPLSLFQHFGDGATGEPLVARIAQHRSTASPKGKLVHIQLGLEGQ
jgi:hypothetical protein